jgi:hypothetical protein
MPKQYDVMGVIVIKEDTKFYEGCEKCAFYDDYSRCFSAPDCETAIFKKVEDGTDNRQE